MSPEPSVEERLREVEERLHEIEVRLGMQLTGPKAQVFVSDGRFNALEAGE